MPYLEFGGGTIKPDEGPRDADKGMGGRLLVGWTLVEQLNLEAVLDYAKFEDKTPSESIIEFFRGNDGIGKSTRMGLGANIVWVPFRSWSPYALAGLGVARTKDDPRMGSGAKLSTTLGIGLTSGGLGSSGVRLRAEARFVTDHRGDKPMDKHYFASISFPLQRSGSASSAPRENERASIPGMPAPPAEPVIDVLPPLVPSSSRPQGDGDRDGVNDAEDRCAGTLAGIRVDETGCAAEGAMVTLQGVSFQDGSANMAATASAPLRQVVVFLRGQPDMTFELRGHTDSVGDPAINQQLSEERARSVARFLIAEGIGDWRITVTGFGESRQVADNDTPQGRATNRRVELRVLLP
jgi:OOP family OmpA-OmpF porin